MTKIKLCGLSREEDIKAANILLPDYIGFVFYEKSRRCISMEKAGSLKKILDTNIKAVGVFVNETHEKILSHEKFIDLIQLHGNENEFYIEKLKNLTRKPIIKAFKINDEKDLLDAEKSPADYVLLDAGSGDGKIFDWSLVKNFKRQFFLAGGLNHENVAEAVKILNPFAVDVSSGIEFQAGIKSPEKMKLFVNSVRSVK